MVTALNNGIIRGIISIGLSVGIFVMLDIINFSLGDIDIAIRILQYILLILGIVLIVLGVGFKLRKKLSN